MLLVSNAYVLSYFLVALTCIRIKLTIICLYFIEPSLFNQLLAYLRHYFFFFLNGVSLCCLGWSAVAQSDLSSLQSLPPELG